MIHKIDVDAGVLILDFAGEKTSLRFTNRSLKRANDAEPDKEEKDFVNIGYRYIPKMIFGSLLVYGGPKLETIEAVADVYYELPFSEQEVIELFVGEFQERQNQATKAILDPEYRKARLKEILSTSGMKTELQPSKSA